MFLLSILILGDVFFSLSQEIDPPLSKLELCCWLYADSDGYWCEYHTCDEERPSVVDLSASAQESEAPLSITKLELCCWLYADSDGYWCEYHTCDEERPSIELSASIPESEAPVSITKLELCCWLYADSDGYWCEYHTCDEERPSVVDLSASAQESEAPVSITKLELCCWLYADSDGYWCEYHTCDAESPSPSPVTLAQEGDHTTSLYSSSCYVCWKDSYGFIQCGFVACEAREMTPTSVSPVTLAQEGDHTTSLYSSSCYVCWKDSYGFIQCGFVACEAREMTPTSVSPSLYFCSAGYTGLDGSHYCSTASGRESIPVGFSSLLKGVEPTLLYFCTVCRGGNGTPFTCETVPCSIPDPLDPALLELVIPAYPVAGLDKPQVFLQQDLDCNEACYWSYYYEEVDYSGCLSTYCSVEGWSAQQAYARGLQTQEGQVLMSDCEACQYFFSGVEFSNCVRQSCWAELMQFDGGCQGCQDAADNCEALLCQESVSAFAAEHFQGKKSLLDARPDTGLDSCSNCDVYSSYDQSRYWQCIAYYCEETLFDKTQLIASGTLRLPGIKLDKCTDSCYYDYIYKGEEYYYCVTNYCRSQGVDSFELYAAQSPEIMAARQHSAFYQNWACTFDGEASDCHWRGAAEQGLDGDSVSCSDCESMEGSSYFACAYYLCGEPTEEETGGEEGAGNDTQCYRDCRAAYPNNQYYFQDCVWNNCTSIATEMIQAEIQKGSLGATQEVKMLGEYCELCIDYYENGYITYQTYLDCISYSCRNYVVGLQGDAETLVVDLVQDRGSEEESYTGLGIIGIIAFVVGLAAWFKVSKKENNIESSISGESQTSYVSIP